MNKIQFIKINFLAVIILLAFACKKEEKKAEEEETPVSYYEFVSRWGQFGESNSSLNDPTKIEATDDFVFINDEGNKKIKKFDHNGNYLGSLDFTAPFYIYNNFLYTVDIDKNTVTKYDLNLNVVNTTQLNEDLNINFCSDFAGNDSTALVAIITSNSPYFKKLNLKNGSVTNLGLSGVGPLEFGNTSYLYTTYSHNRFYITDGGNRRVQITDANLNYLQAFSTESTVVLNQPNVIATSQDYIFVSNSNNGGDQIAIYDINTLAFLSIIDIGAGFKQSIATNGSNVYLLVTYPNTQVQIFKRR